jgi:hypothetical protein
MNATTLPTNPLTTTQLARAMTLGTPIFVQNMNATRFNYHLGTILQLDHQQHTALVQLHDSEGKKIQIPDDRIRHTGLPALPSPPTQLKPVMVLNAPGTARMIVRLFTQQLPPHLVLAHLVPYFQLKRVAHYHAKTASSNRGDFPLTCVTNNKDSEWWISKDQHFHQGNGREWIEFVLGDGIVPLRVSAIGIKIPPLPHGPLSARKFYIEHQSEENGSFQPCSAVFETLDLGTVQRFALSPPIDTSKLRVVMTQSAIGQMVEEKNVKEEDVPEEVGNCVGLFCIKFW